MDDLSVVLGYSPVGCNVNNIAMNHMFYADDSVLLAPSPRALQKLFDICFHLLVLMN